MRHQRRIGDQHINRHEQIRDRHEGHDDFSNTGNLPDAPKDNDAGQHREPETDC